MKPLIVSSTVFLTILVCLAFGVACGYAAVSSILRAFGHGSNKPAAAAHLHAAQAGD